uniref:Heterokaryon incompatibility domain-containing protein n=1 Tax=Bionectria ochroleuca TaxID=29856 RepID=A0A8H7TTW6_BIOOC
MAKRFVKSLIRRWPHDSSKKEEHESPVPSAVARDQDHPLPLPQPVVPRRDNGCTACSSLSSLKRCLDDWDTSDNFENDAVLYSWEFEPIHRLPPEEQMPPCEMCTTIQDEISIVGGCHGRRENLMKYLKIYSNLKKWIGEVRASQPISQSAIETNTKLEQKLQNCRDLFKAKISVMDRPDSVDTPSQALDCGSQLDEAIQEARLLYPDEVLTAAFNDFISLCENILRVMEQPLSRHQASKYCLWCIHEGRSPESLDGLAKRLYQVHPAGLTQALKDHPIPWCRGSYNRSLIDRVQIQLQSEETWKGLKFQEYELDPSKPAGNQAALRSGDEYQRTTKKPIEEGFRAIHRQPSKDEVLYVPISSDKPCFARFVQPKFDIGLVNKWLNRCHSDHGSRCITETSGQKPKNLILVDTEKNCLVTLTDGHTPPYLALSYVWGGVPQAELTRLTLDKWHEPGSLTEEATITQKVRDAMAITKQTSLRFLWVDALCIVQDDDSQRQEQINQMFLIYHQAEATIVAADGPSCDLGLSGVSIFEEREHLHKPFLIQDTPMARVLRDPRQALQASKWRTRGWTLQEEVCSTRTIIFLPSVVLFSCPTAVWREDLHLENVQNPWGTLFYIRYRELWRTAYTQRTLTREDDMGNAFAGISRMMEGLIGPIYHGIPERYFAQIISGCWFWGMCCARRPAFPSWSWMGWIYTKEQAGTGIEPTSWPGETAGLLTFFKLADGAEMLPEPVLESPVLDSLQPGLREHFTPDLSQIQSQYASLASSLEQIPPGLICFYTSLSFLKLRPLYKNAASLVQEYLVLSPITEERLTSLYLKKADVNESGELQPFIVIAAQRGEVGKTGLRLMFVRMTERFCYKVNVTSQRKLVSEAAWWDLNPSKRLVVMG